jgi:hypothetical protein
MTFGFVARLLQEAEHQDVVVEAQFDRILRNNRDVSSLEVAIDELPLAIVEESIAEARASIPIGLS